MTEPAPAPGRSVPLTVLDGPDRLDTLARCMDTHRAAGRRIVTTNGCFDLLHAGHVRMLASARALGDVLVVGLNGDASVRRLKGAGRPHMGVEDRAELLRALAAVDHVVVFDTLLPIPFLGAVRPHIHCKGGDYAAEDLPEADVVLRNGGQIRIIPLVEGRASSRLGGGPTSTPTTPGAPVPFDEPEQPEQTRVLAHFLTWSNVVRQSGYALSRALVDEAREWQARLDQGARLFVCGNGGSASDAEHFTAELLGRFMGTQRGVPILDLSHGGAVLTSLANDFSFAEVFSRQLESQARAGDVLLAISTSGRSANIRAALESARHLGMRTVLLTGGRGRTVEESSLSDVTLAVPAETTVDIQQGHRAVLHALCIELAHRLESAPR